MSFLNFWRVFQPAKEVKMEKRMKTVSKSIDLAVSSRSVVPEVSSPVFSLIYHTHFPVIYIAARQDHDSEIYLHTYGTPQGYCTGS